MAAGVAGAVCAAGDGGGGGAGFGDDAVFGRAARGPRAGFARRGAARTHVCVGLFPGRRWLQLRYDLSSRQAFWRQFIYPLHVLVRGIGAFLNAVILHSLFLLCGPGVLQ